MKEKDQRILKFIKTVKRYVNRDVLVRNMHVFLVTGLGAFLLVSLISLFVPFYNALMYGALACAFTLIIGITYSIIKFKNKKQAALIADSKGLKERVSTAYEFMGREDIFARIQKEDTIRAISGFNIKEHFPLKLMWKWLLSAGLLIVCILVTSMIETPAKIEAVKRKELKELAKEKEEELVEKYEELLKYETLTAEQLEEMEELLDKALKELADAKSEAGMEKAEERLLTKLEQELTKNYMEQMQAIQSMMQGLEGAMNEELAAEELEKLLEELKEMAEAMESDELKELAELMEGELAQSGTVSSTNMNNAMAQLSQMSANMQQMLNNQSQSGQQGQTGQQGQSGQQGQTGQQGQSGQQGQGGQSGQGNGGNGQGGTGWYTGSSQGNEEDSELNGEKITISNNHSDNNIQGSASGDESQLTQDGPTMTWEGIEIPYNQVIAEYTNQAYENLSGSDIPDSMKDIVKDYFSELNN